MLLKYWVDMQGVTTWITTLSAPILLTPILPAAKATQVQRVRARSVIESGLIGGKYGGNLHPRWQEWRGPPTPETRR